MRNNEWLQNRLDYLRGLRKPTAQQQLLMALAGLPQRSPKEQRRLDVLVRAERFAEKAHKARGEANKVLSEEQRQLRKKRDHGLYRAAGWLGLAGVVDGTTGELRIDAGVLVGILSALQNGELGEVSKFKTLGDRVIADRKAKRQDGTEAASEPVPEN